MKTPRGGDGSSIQLKGPERDDEALRLRLREGKELAEIAHTLRYRTMADARRGMVRAIGRLPRTDAEQCRRMMTERLEHLYALVLAKTKDDLAAIKIAASIVVELAKLNGVKDGKKPGVGERDGATISVTTARDVLEAIRRRKKAAVS